MDRNSNPVTMRSVIGVALRKESVDRNIWPVAYDATNHASLSARRAWIEIPAWAAPGRGRAGRSPQGERG